MKSTIHTLRLYLLIGAAACGQTTTAPIYDMSIFAGIPTSSSLGDDGPSTYGVVTNPNGVAVDAGGNIYIADNTNSRIRKIDATTGFISTFASKSINGPNGMAFDKQGNLYVANGGNHTIVRLDSKGTATTIVGFGNGRYSGDLQNAADAQVNGPGGVAVDDAGNLYIADTSNHRVRMVKM